MYSGLIFVKRILRKPSPSSNEEKDASVDWNDEQTSPFWAKFSLWVLSFWGEGVWWLVVRKICALRGGIWSVGGGYVPFTGGYVPHLKIYAPLAEKYVPIAGKYGPELGEMRRMTGDMVP